MENVAAEISRQQLAIYKISLQVPNRVRTVALVGVIWSE